MSADHRTFRAEPGGLAGGGRPVPSSIELALAAMLREVARNRARRRDILTVKDGRVALSRPDRLK